LFFAPFALPLTLLAGLLSLAVLGGGLYLVWAWYTGLVVGTAYLVGGIALTIVTFAGRWLVLRFRRPGDDEPLATRGGEVRRLPRPDGSELHVELYGPVDAPPMVLTHGWGMDATAWYYAKRQLGDRFRLILWDLPGLGESRKPDNNDFALEKLARDLDAVLSLAGQQPVILLGYSIGGMITLTWCRLFPHKLGEQVVGLVLAHTTYTNPVETTTASRAVRALQKPVIEPLLHLIVWLSPLVWLTTWLSYLNGSAHLAAMLTGFGGRETRGQLDFATAFGPRASPAVQARGVLAMLRYDATATLSTLDVPVLVVTGHLDRLTVPEASARLTDAVPSGALVPLAPAGHMGVLEQYAYFAAVVTAFAARCTTTAPLGKEVGQGEDGSLHRSA
jgi:pimeloyl-ACP methyl ester carboxylesterase